MQVIGHGPHDVNRARAMPQDPTIIATRSDCADIYLFKAAALESLEDQDSTPTNSSSGAHPSGENGDAMSADSAPLAEGVLQAASPSGEAETAGFDPFLTLRKHRAGGFGLAWSPQRAGQLLTAGDDGMACLWDLGSSAPGSDYLSSREDAGLTVRACTVGVGVLGQGAMGQHGENRMQCESSACHDRSQLCTCMWHASAHAVTPHSQCPMILRSHRCSITAAAASMM
jgi:WD40 repeat protein